MGCEGCIKREDDIVAVPASETKIEATARLVPTKNITRPLIIGSSVVLTDDRELVIVGGAATCFSMGTFCTSRDSQLFTSFFQEYGSSADPISRGAKCIHIEATWRKAEHFTLGLGVLAY